MNRILLLAKRDYLQTVQSKAYLIGLVLFPLLFGGGFLVVSLTNRSNTKAQRIAVIDRTGVSAAAVIQACEEANGKAMLNATGLQVTPRFKFEEVKPEADEANQLLSLSDRIRAGELFLALDISPESVRYYTNAATINQSALWLPAAVNDGLRRVRLAQLGVDEARAAEALRDVPLVPMNLVTTDPATGKIVQSEKRNALRAAAVPIFLAVLLIMVVMVGSAPNLGAVAEDKMQRVFEMLLSSASSFDLMMGKLLAALGVSLTSSIFYIVGGLLVLAGMAMFGLAPLDLLPWFFVYLIADVLLLSAFGVALGSACATPQDAQHLVIFLMLPVVVPIFVLAPVMQQPSGALATVMSFIPPFHAGADAAAAGAAWRSSRVAAMARLGGRNRLRRRCDLGRRPHLPHRHPLPRQDAKARGAGAMGGARVKTQPSAFSLQLSAFSLQPSAFSFQLSAPRICFMFMFFGPRPTRFRR